ncbi:hypothetical protein OXYTRIMIC_018 [Oxytricha trifallax]|uniref:Uncharacterized protein n=1 Tax=Oxytricha trifallax TaxID=1172189 RepID=A0A073HZD5_9SPIT|nr:hypothetical protein OXYTRIMIC_018 [Oxytricha trifallax]
MVREITLPRVHRNSAKKCYFDNVSVIFDKCQLITSMVWLAWFFNNREDSTLRWSWVRIEIMYESKVSFQMCKNATLLLKSLNYYITIMQGCS